MSLSEVRPYLKRACKELSLVEHKDGFNFENIASNVLNKSFFIEMNDVTQGIRKNQNDQEASMPISLKVFIKGYRNPSDAIDSSIALVETLIKKCVDPVNALTQCNGIKSVSFDSARYEPISDSNDNAVMATVVFRFLVIINVG